MLLPPRPAQEIDIEVPIVDCLRDNPFASKTLRDAAAAVEIEDADL